MGGLEEGGVFVRMKEANIPPGEEDRSALALCLRARFPLFLPHKRSKEMVLFHRGVPAQLGSARFGSIQALFLYNSVPLGCGF